MVEVAAMLLSATETEGARVALDVQIEETRLRALSINCTALPPEQQLSYRVPVSELPVGASELEVVATDGLGQQGRAVVTLHVDEDGVVGFSDISKARTASSQILGVYVDAAASEEGTDFVIRVADALGLEAVIRFADLVGGGASALQKRAWIDDSILSGVVLDQVKDVSVQDYLELAE